MAVSHGFYKFVSMAKITYSHHQKGETAEANACTYLEKQGLQTLWRNFRCRLGEIDLIMQDGDTIVFVEVRYRNNPRYGSSLESVNWQKQRKLINAASFYLQQRNITDTYPCRFDVIALEKDTGNITQWIKDAFQAD